MSAAGSVRDGRRFTMAGCRGEARRREHGQRGERGNGSGKRFAFMISMAPFTQGRRSCQSHHPWNRTTVETAAFFARWRPAASTLVASGPSFLAIIVWAARSMTRTIGRRDRVEHGRDERALVAGEGEAGGVTDGRVAHERRGLSVGDLEDEPAATRAAERVDHEDVAGLACGHAARVHEPLMTTAGPPPESDSEKTPATPSDLSTPEK